MGSQREEHLAAVRRERRRREFSNVDFIVQQGVQWRKAGLVGETRERERERENCVVQSAGHNCYLRDIVQSVI